MKTISFSIVTIAICIFIVSGNAVAKDKQSLPAGACAMLPTAAISSATNGNFVNAKETNRERKGKLVHSRCNYTDEAINESFTLLVQLLSPGSDMKVSRDVDIRSLTEQGLGDGIKPLDVNGDPGYSNSSMGQLAVYRNNMLIMVSGMPIQAWSEERLQQAAKAIK